MFDLLQLIRIPVSIRRTGNGMKKSAKPKGVKLTSKQKFLSKKEKPSRFNVKTTTKTESHFVATITMELTVNLTMNRNWF